MVNHLLEVTSRYQCIDIQKIPDGNLFVSVSALAKILENRTHVLLVYARIIERRSQTHFSSAALSPWLFSAFPFPLTTSLVHIPTQNANQTLSRKKIISMSTLDSMCSSLDGHGQPYAQTRQSESLCSHFVACKYK